MSVMTATPPAPTEVQPLTAHDRCDRCGAQAYVRSKHPDHRSDLLWCGHHYGDNIETLFLDEHVIDDQRWRLDQVNDAFKGADV